VLFRLPYGSVVVGSHSDRVIWTESWVPRSLMTMILPPAAASPTSNRRRHLYEHREGRADAFDAGRLLAPK